MLGVLRNQAPPDREIGWDVSAAVQYRPFMSQNVVLNASAAALLPGKGLKQLYDEDRRGPAVLDPREPDPHLLTTARGTKRHLT